MYKIKGVDLKTYQATKKIKRQQRRSTATERPVQKKRLTPAEKELLAEKIQGSRDENIDKSFVGKSNPVYRTIAVIVLILLFFLLIVWAVVHSS